MSTPEAKVKAQVKKLLEAEKIWHFFPAANGYGRAGIPDIIACVNGILLAIECKAGKGTTTALQDRELQRIRDAGGSALTVNDTPETFRTLGTTIRALQLRTA